MSTNEQNTSNDPSKEAIDHFFKLLSEKKEKDDLEKKRNEEIVAKKNAILIPIRKLLKTMMDHNIIVHHRGKFSTDSINSNMDDVRFEVSEDPSSPSWAPGISIYLKHPAEIEIAVPNDEDIKNQGVIIIKCVSEHRNKKILQGPFHSVDSACRALSEFIAMHTTSFN